MPDQTRVKRAPARRALTIYCDESDISGKHFGNFYGGLLVDAGRQAEVEARLKAACARLRLNDEVQWQKIIDRVCRQVHRAHGRVVRHRGGGRHQTIDIDARDIAEVDSKRHVLLQCVDVVLGAMQFRLNDKHKEKPEGSRTRGKRTIAKEGVYRHILARIQQIYPRFNIGRPTSLRVNMTNLWKDSYRHWLFVPKDAQRRPEFAKRTSIRPRVRTGCQLVERLAHSRGLSPPRSTSCTSSRCRRGRHRSAPARHRAGSACAASAPPPGGG